MTCAPPPPYAPLLFSPYPTSLVPVPEELPARGVAGKLHSPFRPARGGPRLNLLGLGKSVLPTEEDA
jgi:hypothetical protein